MDKKELRFEQKRISEKLKGLRTIATISVDAQIQIEFLSEELKWVELQLKNKAV